VRKLLKVKKVKYLVIIIDQDLSWTPRIQMQCSKIARGNWALANLRILVKIPLKYAYYGLVYPHLQYCASILSQVSNKSILKPIEVLQK